MEPSSISRSKIVIYSSSALLGILLIITLVASMAPSDFPTGRIVRVTKGEGLSSIAKDLYTKGVIRSVFMFKVYSTLRGTTNIKAGNYYFGEPEGAVRVSYRLIQGIEGVPKIKVTVPEGLATPDIARLIKRLIPEFDSVGFLTLARPLEGYLFPDTYFFTQFTTPEEAIKAMRDNFDEKVAAVQIPGGLGSKLFDEVITMASIIEEEATSSTDRRIISGILWKRLEAGMPLQVDAPFFYLFGKTSAQITVRDLATTSPYNLYKNKGLPPTPIDNPSLDSIKAAVTPTNTKYWFFLSGSDGRVHYAETLEGHIANKKYLR